ncbi:MAG: hypothetical protein AAGI52_16025 [Bacteroidota bacterium]
MRHAVAFSLLLALAACSTPPSGGDGPPALLDLWTGLDAGAEAAGAEYQSETCSERFGTYFADFGVRGLACVAEAAVPLGQALARYDGEVFASGPHRHVGGTLSLDLLSDDFAHYDADFVTWAAENAIVGADDPAVRALAQPIYNRHLRRLARAFWLVHQDLAADGFPRNAPAGMTQAYATYLETGTVPESASEPYYPGFSMTAFSDRNEAIAERLAGAGRAEYYSALYEANTAVGFWLRRRADGTAGAFRDALRTLLSTYDADWLGRA